MHSPYLRTHVAANDGGQLGALKRQKTEGEVQKAVAEHNVPRFTASSSFSLTHVAWLVEEKPTEVPIADACEEPGNYAKNETIWGHSRYMALSGRPLDDLSRSKFIADSAGLPELFGSSKFA